MKKYFSIVLFLFSITLLAQAKKVEAVNKKDGKSIIFEQNNRVKLITQDRKKLVGDLTIKDNETIAINGIEVALTNVSSIKNFPKGERKAKNILYGVGSGLIIGSGIAGAAKNGSAFALFSGGTASVIVGALVNNKHKAATYRNSIFKIVE